MVDLTSNYGHTNNANVEYVRIIIQRMLLEHDARYALCICLHIRHTLSEVKAGVRSTLLQKIHTKCDDTFHTHTHIP